MRRRLDERLRQHGCILFGHQTKGNWYHHTYCRRCGAYMPGQAHRYLAA